MFFIHSSSSPAADADEQHQLVARVLAKPWCGDNKCNGGERCDTCAADCGCANGETCTAGSCVSGGPSPTTPSPSPTPPSASCGRCVVDDQISCSAPTDCPTTSVQGTCSTKSSNSGSSCSNDSQCLPNSGKPANRGTCDGGSTTNTQCDTSLSCSPTTAPVSTPMTSSPTKAPTAAPSSEPTNSPTAAPMTSSPTKSPSGSPTTAAPSSEPTKAPTAAPVTSSPTKTPTGSPNTPSPTPNPTTSSPTEQFFCGCPSCTLDIWDAMACSDAFGGCFTCGGRIEYVANQPGLTLNDACWTVSNQFPSGPCGPACNPDICNDNVLDEPDPAKLVWSDEFDVDGAPDPNKWDYDIGNGCNEGICDWGNNELQWYTNSNAVVSNGVLRITAKKESVGGKQYTSSRMVSRGKQTFRYGRIRIRARMAGCTALGTWPALWMLPEAQGGWPSSGEIDIVEMVGYETDKFHASIHTQAYNHGIGTQKTGSITKSEVDWHIFEIDWQVDRIRFAMDAEVYFVFAPEDVNNYEQWPFNEDFHILMNIAVGGNWGGLNGVDASAFEGDGQHMEVDWVRAYSM